jgi:hypothetical protein
MAIGLMSSFAGCAVGAKYAVCAGRSQQVFRLKP